MRWATNASSAAQVDSGATPPHLWEAAVALEYLVVTPNDRSCGRLGGAGRPPRRQPTASSRAAAADTDDRTCHWSSIPGEDPLY
jgi:hypothetical protein